MFHLMNKVTCVWAPDQHACGKVWRVGQPGCPARQLVHTAGRRTLLSADACHADSGWRCFTSPPWIRWGRCRKWHDDMLDDSHNDALRIEARTWSNWRMAVSRSRHCRIHVVWALGWIMSVPLFVLQSASHLTRGYGSRCEFYELTERGSAGVQRPHNLILTVIQRP